MREPVFPKAGLQVPTKRTIRAAFGPSLFSVGPDSEQDILWQVLRRGLSLVGLGAALGLLLASGLTRLLTGFLYGVSPFDPATFITVPLLLGLVALAACWLPARRATRVDPIVALRYE